MADETTPAAPTTTAPATTGPAREQWLHETLEKVFLSPRVGRLSMRIGPRMFMGSGPVIAAASLLALVWLKPGFDYWYALLPPLVGFSVGLSLRLDPLSAVMVSN